MSNFCNNKAACALPPPRFGVSLELCVGNVAKPLLGAMGLSQFQFMPLWEISLQQIIEQHTSTGYLNLPQIEARGNNVRGERARPGATTGTLKASSDLARMVTETGAWHS